MQKLLMPIILLLSLTACQPEVSAADPWAAHQELVLDGEALPAAGSWDVVLGVYGVESVARFEYLRKGGSVHLRREIVEGADRGEVVLGAEGGFDKSFGGAVRRLSAKESEATVMVAFLLSGEYLSSDAELVPADDGFADYSMEVIFQRPEGEYLLRLDDEGALTSGYASLAESYYGLEFGPPRVDFPHLPESLTIYPDGEPAQEVVLTDYDSADTITAEHFNKPAPSGMSYDHSTEAALPFRIVNGQLLVTVLMNGVEVELVLDSGATASYITAGTAKRLGLEELGIGSVVSAGNDVSEYGLAVLDELTLGPVTLTDQLFVMGDSSLLLALAAPHLDGLLGYDLLARLPVRFDFTAKLLELLPPDEEPVIAEGAIVLPLELPGRLPVLTGELNGVPDLRLALDSGAAVEMLVLPRSSNRLMSAAGLSPTDGVLMSFAGLGGAMSTLMFRDSELLLAGYPVTVGRVFYALGDADGPLSIIDADALLGLPFLLNFSRITFDYPRERLILEP